MAKSLKLLSAALMTMVLLLAIQTPAHSQTASRRLYVNATNESGAPVLDLDAAEFEVREGGEKRDISRVALIHRPMRIALVVDTSRSAAVLVPQIRDAVRAFIDEVEPQHEIVLITTGGTLRVRVPPTTDRERLTAASELLSADGANVLLSALDETYNRFLRSGDYYPILVVMTLADPGSRTWFGNGRLDQLARAIRSQGGTVHGALWNTGPWSPGSIFPDVDICATLAKATDGFCVEVLKSAQLTDTVARLARRINQDYRSSPSRYGIEYAGVGKNAKTQVQVTRPRVRAEILSSR
jgi:hypothetical protein